jgi:hypothetical protein
MTTDRERLAARVASADAEIDETEPVREAEATRAGDDSAAIVQLRDGRYAFVHEQPATNGVGMVIAADVAICEDAARRARYLGQPSTVATRLGLTEEEPDPREPSGGGGSR